MNFEDIEQKLNNLKVDYQATKLPRDLEEQGFWQVLGKLEERKIRVSKRPFWFAGAAFMAVIILSFTSGWKKVEAALPGDSLYPVKRFSEEIVSKVNKDSQIKVENRANEVVGLVKKEAKDDKALNQVTAEYEKEVQKVNQSVKLKEKKEFDRKLERHQEEFKKIIKEQPESKKKLEKAIEVTDKLREENKDKEEEKDREEQDSHSSSRDD